jgi:hypothetical protein
LGSWESGDCGAALNARLENDSNRAVTLKTANGILDEDFISAQCAALALHTTLVENTGI